MASHLAALYGFTGLTVHIWASLGDSADPAPMDKTSVIPWPVIGRITGGRPVMHTTTGIVPVLHGPTRVTTVYHGTNSLTLRGINPILAIAITENL